GLSPDHQSATAFLYQGGEIFRRAARLFINQNYQSPVIIQVAFTAVPLFNLPVSPKSCSGERSGFKKVISRHERSSTIAAQIDDQSRGINQSSQFFGEALVIRRNPGLEANIAESRVKATRCHHWLIVTRKARHRGLQFPPVIRLESDGDRSVSITNEEYTAH